MKPKKLVISKISIALLVIFGFTAINANVVNAQRKHEISGQVKDKLSKKPLEFCTVKIMTVKDSLLSGASTNSKGYFTTMLPNGKYKIVVEYIGYKPNSTDVNVVGKDLFLGNIQMQVSDNSIDEISIKGASTNNKLDRDVVAVTSKLKAGAANTKDVLDKIQGVQYDRYKNTIKVDNDANIMILVDGLEKDQEYIKNLNPERLQKIEIIRDPGGRYGLDGYSAVINVILKTNYRGTDIEASTFLILDLDNEDKKYWLPNSFYRISANHTVDKLNLYTSADFYTNLFALDSKSLKTFKSGLSIENTAPDDKPNTKMDNKGDSYNIGLDYKINPQHTFSFELDFGGFFGENNSINTYQSVYRQNNAEINRLLTNSDNTSKNKNQKYSLYYTGKLNTKLSVNASAYYLHSKDNLDNLFWLNNDKPRQELGYNTNDKLKFYTEFNYDISPKSALMFGYGFEKVEKKSLINIVGTNSGLPGTEQPENKFKYNDTRNRAYTYYSINPSKKLGLKIGMAAEFSKSENDEHSNNFTGYQPFLNIKYVPLKFLDIRIKYRARNNYPSISQTNPTEYMSDNQSVNKGNPNLKPAVNHGTSIRFNIMNGLASIEPYYNFSQDYIAQIATFRDDGIIEYSYDNVGKYYNMGIKAGLTIPFGKSVFFQNNANLYSYHISYKNIDNEVKDWRLNSQLIYMNKKYSTVAGLLYQKNNAKRIKAQGYYRGNNDFWGIFAQQPFLKKRLNVMIGYAFPIDWGATFYQDNYKKTELYTEESKIDLSVIKNAIFFHISYRFSKGKTRKKSIKKGDNDSESNSGGMKLF